MLQIDPWAVAVGFGALIVYRVGTDWIKPMLFKKNGSSGNGTPMNVYRKLEGVEKGLATHFANASTEAKLDRQRVADVKERLREHEIDDKVVHDKVIVHNEKIVRLEELARENREDHRVFFEKLEQLPDKLMKKLNGRATPPRGT